MDFFLTSDVSFCDVWGRLVFLNLSEDRYFCLTQAAEASLRKVIGGTHLDAADEERLDRLVDRGVLERRAEGYGGIASCPLPAAPTHSLLDEDLDRATFWSTLAAVVRTTHSIAMLARRPLAANLAITVQVGHEPWCRRRA